MKRILLLALAMATVGSASANSITTLFAGGNGGSTLWTNYFDINVLTSGITVNAFDVNVSSSVGTPFTLDVYTRTGTYSGFEVNGGAGWTLVSTGGSGISNGSGVATNVDVPDFSLGSGVSGIAIRYMGAAMNYTNGNGSNQNYSDGIVSLSLGSAASTATAPFDGSSLLFTPRVWNGTMYYTPVPEPATMAALGIGVLAILRRRRARSAR